MYFKVKIDDITQFGEPHIFINKILALPNSYHCVIQFRNIGTNIILENSIIAEANDLESNLTQLYRSKIWYLFCHDSRYLNNAYEFIKNLYKGKTLEELLEIKRYIDNNAILRKKGI